jgi:hypothetical protein
MSNDLITLDREYQTRSGKPVRVHATDIAGGRPVLASHLDHKGDWVAYDYYPNGRIKLDEETPFDLIEKPKVHKIVSYVNVYSDGGCAHRRTRQEADGCSGKTRIACKRIEIEVMEGEFDE